MKEMSFMTRLTKRIFDVAVSLFILIWTSPFILTVLVFIFLEHVIRGNAFDPLFYTDTRLSKGKKFKLIKFNTLNYADIREERERKGFIHTKIIERRGKVKWIGWVLKQTYMDELPQMINVLKGDMSIVGPRPVNEDIYNYILEQGFSGKRDVKAGITGNYQATKNIRVNANRLDKEYAEYILSHPWYKVLLFDLRIILKTFRVLARAKGV